MPLLSLENVAIAFGAEVIVSGVTLNLEAGDRLAVVGANRAGKDDLHCVAEECGCMVIG